METIIFHERLIDFKKIESTLVASRVLLSPYAVESVDTYKLENYLVDQTVKVSCLLDRNIVSYLSDFAKGIELNSSYEQSRCHRITAGLQAFLSAANVQSEPGLSYHEYMDNASIALANKELSYFRSADNIDANIYLNIALMNTNRVPDKAVPKFSCGGLADFDTNQRVKAFEFNIVVIKKAISIRSTCLNDYQAINLLLEWVFKEYVFCRPAFYFLAIYFSNKRISKMLKSSSYASVRNAAWDLALLQHWITLSNRDTEQTWLLASMDKAILETANLINRSTETQEDYLNRLQIEFSTMWGKKSGHGKKLFKRLSYWLQNSDCPSRKTNQPENRTQEYMLALRAEVDNEYRSVKVV